MHGRSRCTGYRPILDAFKVFAKADPAAYTEESIAASKCLENGTAKHKNEHNGTADDGPATQVPGVHGHTGSGHGTNGHASISPNCDKEKANGQVGGCGRGTNKGSELKTDGVKVSNAVHAADCDVLLEQ